MAEKDKKKKKPSIMKGNSPWESKAIRQNRAMKPAETKIHRAFVAGKKAARAEMKTTGKTPARTVYKGLVATAGGIAKNPKLTNKQVVKGKKSASGLYDIKGKKSIASDESLKNKVRKAAAYNMGEARARQMAFKKRYGKKAK